MDQENRIVTMQEREEDNWQFSLRPRYLKEYIGQTQAKENLHIFIEAAKLRGDTLDHVLPVSYTHLTLPTILLV